MPDLDLNKIQPQDLPSEYPGVQNDNMDKIQTGIDSIDSSISGLESTTSQNTSDISQNASDLVAISGNLQAQIDAISGGNGGGTVDLTAVETDIIPTISGGLDLGSPTKPFRDLYLTQNSMYLGANKLSVENGKLLLNDENTGATPEQIETIDNLVAITGQQQAEIDANTLAIDNLDLNYATDADLLAVSGNLNAKIDTEVDDLQTQIESLAGISGGSGGFIGEGRDGNYDGGLFPFLPVTQIGHAIDDMNVFLSSFAPPLPSSLGSMSSNSGQTGKLSYDSGNIPAGYNDHGQSINDTFNVSGTKKGIFNDSTSLTGTLADNQSAHAFSYPANAFNEGNVGALELWINGVMEHSIDLTSFVSGSDLNGNGSGFNLTVATPVQFESGQELDAYQYRTGTWTVHPDDLVNGYNTVQVIHNTGSSNTTQQFEYFIDAETNSVSLVTQTIDGLTMASAEYLSGVKYHPSGTFDFNFNVNNAYDVTHSTSSITFSTGNSSISSLSIPNAVDPTDAIDTSVVGTISSARLLDESVSVQATVPKTLSRGTTLANISNFNLLVDPFINNLSGTTNTKDTLNTETYRISEELYANQTNLRNVSYGSGGVSPFTYDGTKNIYSASGYTNGLMQYDGKIVYPNSAQVVNNGAFNAISDGPLSNVNYSLSSGNRVYMRMFYFGVGGDYRKFSLGISRTNTNFVTVASGPSGNNVTVEVLLPNGTTDQNGSDNTTGNVEFKDCSVPFSTSVEGAIGCEWEDNTDGRDFGIAFGGRSTDMSGGVVIVRITASDSWTGSLEEIELVTV